MTDEKGRLGRLPLFLWALLFVSAPALTAEEIPYAWTGVERVVAVADIHGDYEQFVYIMAHPQVGLIDSDLRWIGGKAHFVQLGDIADRGPGARKVYETLMRLEREAAAAGGHRRHDRTERPSATLSGGVSRSRHGNSRHFVVRHRDAHRVRAGARAAHVQPERLLVLSLG
ncbi:MAG TPA: hypothetical protein PLP83_08335, partial [Candidatus Aminicenantes bacterium]|nr:hypothetical protein [Candidatus Aminicenantes bacterium]